MDLKDSNDKLLIVACRFVPYDQWLVTHLDTSWTIKQVKHWILSKCNLVRAPDLPRYRSASPITFAATGRSRGASFDKANGSGTDDEDTDDDADESSINSTRNRNLAYSWHSQPPRRSESSVDEAPDSIVAAEYMILTFSNSHILDDDFRLSWYNILPYELLEIHPAGSVIRLPREVVVHYARPYFEARVRAAVAVARHDWQSSREGLVGRVGVGRSKSRQAGKGRSSDPLVYVEKETDKKRKWQWMERWVVIHQGVLSVRKNRQDQSPSHRIPLTSIMALRGAEHLPSASSTSTVTGQHIVCAKYRISSGKQWKTSPNGSSSAMSSRSQAKASSRRRDLPESTMSASSSRSQAASATTPLSSTSSSFRSHTTSNTTPSPGPSLSVDEFHKEWKRNRKGRSRLERDLAGGEKTPGGWGDSNTAASTDVSTDVSASVSEDEGGEETKKWRGFADKGKEKCVSDKDKRQSYCEEIEQGGEEQGEWLIMDLCEDNAFTAILRILHRHSPRPITSSFLPRSSTLISNTAMVSPSSSSPLSSTTAVSFTSPFPQSAISRSDSETMYQSLLGALPYPEWRIDLVSRARQAGLGDVGKVVAHLFGGETENLLSSAGPAFADPPKWNLNVVGQEEVAECSSAGRTRMDTISVATQGAHESSSTSPDIGEEIDDDDDDLELSDCEWEGWMRDLDRQGHIERSRSAKEASRDQESASSAVTPSPTTPSNPSSAGSPEVPPRSLRLSLVTASSSALDPCTPCDQPDPQRSMPNSPLSVQEGSNTPTVQALLYPPVLQDSSSLPVSPRPTHTRQRSSTVTAPSSRLRKKDKTKDDESLAPRNEDIRKEISANSNAKKRKSVLSKPHLSLTFPDSSPSDMEDYELAQTFTAVPVDRLPSRTSILRHVRSASNLRRDRAENPEPPCPLGPEVSAAGDRKSTGLVKGVSAQAERFFVKGWDSAVGFVDGRVGFGAGSIYGL